MPIGYSDISSTKSPCSGYTHSRYQENTSMDAQQGLKDATYSVRSTFRSSRTSSPVIWDSQTRFFATRHIRLAQKKYLRDAVRWWSDHNDTRLHEGGMRRYEHMMRDAGDLGLSCTWSSYTRAGNRVAHQTDGLALGTARYSKLNSEWDPVNGMVIYIKKPEDELDCLSLLMIGSLFCNDI